MSDWKQRMAAQLSAGVKPSYEDLEEALQGALEERAAFKKGMEDMASWLGMIAAAFIKGDVAKLADTVAAFVQQRVKTCMPGKTPKH